MEKQRRNPQETQQKILIAALEEFSTHGYHGARVDRIVKSAQVNKRMVYHYFGDKEGLFKALMKAELDKISDVGKTQPTDSLFELSSHWLANSDKIKDYFRLVLSAESLVNKGEISLDNEHADSFRFSTDIYANLLAGKDVDPKYFLLAMVSITAFPMVMPHMVKYIVGEESDESRYQEEYSKVLKLLLQQD